MAAETLSDFDLRYLQTWTEPDAEKRRANIERMWVPDGRLVVSSLGLTVRGVEDIAAHVGRVYEQQIVGNGLRFAYDQHVEADDALLLRWSMHAPGDRVAGRGVDVVFRAANGRIETVYMFMGIA